MNNEILIRYIKKKNKIRKIVSYKSVDCRLRIYHKKVNEFLKQNFINSLFSYAYVENRSIYDNAKAHMYNDFFIMLDIKNFFNNITHEKLIKRLYIEINKKNKNAITLLECAEIVKKCSVSNRGIPLGFVTSPILANIYLKEFDNILYGKLKKLTAENIIYTRYADDLCISFKNNINNEEIKEEIIKIVSKLLKRYSLKLNNNKTRNYNINVVNHIKITGINIVVKENGKRTLSVGKKIKNNLFWCAINLYKDKNSNKDYQKQSLRIKGLNSFILSIEKNGYEDCYSEKMKNIIIKLGFENLQDLIKNL
ncbi:MAG: reverse transcriptase domain-containing protein [Clostridia bacterium]|mgnify:FL=1